MIEDQSHGTKNYKAIVCEQIPELFLDKIVAKKHFSRFGKIKRFILRPNRLSCTIEYENKEDAKNACLNAGNFSGIDFIVTYADHEVAHVQNTEEWVDPEVQAELDAMSTGQRLDAALRHSIMQKSNINRADKSKINFSFQPKTIKATTRSKQNSPQPDISKIDGALRLELEAVLKSPAFTDEEKYRVLDARDKLIRLTSVRQTDIKKAKATKGTCPDMCPEKERLMREFQRQVSIFETTEEEGSESKMSHKKAIKEYSRSSADQEVPLSHELRSESVLEMTMLYLVHRIMGLCDDPKTSLCDWFHFVWDRTRSIRKDITQQELCSLAAVQLVEQCARFHIHCSARLVAEDPSVFDKKINAENLTKCLQTLKYMYHDLRIKGVECPCEAEFRGYMIILNLGDSNFLWEFKQLPENIQKSVEIKRAIAFYNALQNNNFVKFFSMIKDPETSYLSACILLGYFTRLRVRAMDAIIKSHNWRKNDVYLPMSYLTDILGFDDNISAANFFNHYGLHCDLIEKRVLLDRLIKPNIEYAMDRALKLVESKRNVSIGECIFGQKLPSAYLFEHHQPHCSFDMNGMLKIESLNSLDYLMDSNGGAKIEFKEQEDAKSFSNEINLFKIPKSISVFPTKPQRNPFIQEEEKKEIKESAFDSFNIRNGENSRSSDGTKFDDNMFTEITSPQSTTESIVELPTTTIKSEKVSNNLFQAAFNPTTDKFITPMGNIFEIASKNVQSNSKNIFSFAVGQNANICQKKENISKDIFVKDDLFRGFKTFTERLYYPNTNQSVSAGSERNNILSNEIDNESLSENYENNVQIKENENQHKFTLKKSCEKDKDKEKDKEDERRKNKLKIILEEKSVETTGLFLINIVEEEVFEIAQNELTISQNIMKASNVQKEILITEVVKACVEHIANEEYSLICYDQLLLSRYFTRWLMHLRQRKYRRTLIEDTPLWITTDTRAQHALAIKHPSQQKNLEMIKRYRLGQSFDLNILFKTEYNEQPLNLFALVGQHLLSKHNFTSSGLLQERKYLKFLITLPENNEELHGFENISNKWLIKLIEKCQAEGGVFLSGVEHNVALCVRKLIGVIPKNEMGNKMTTEGDHNDGVVCCITGLEIETHSRKRLHSLLKLTKNLKRIPLAIIAYNCNYNENEVAALLGLDALQQENLIYSYLILGCQIKRKDFSFRNLFIKAVDFITKESYILNSNEMQSLAMQNLLPFLEVSLGVEMWQKWYDSTKLNPIMTKIFCLPEHVLGIYHKALDHLLYITQEEFDEMPEFPQELKEFVPENTSLNIPLGLEYFPLNWKEKKDKSIIKSFLQALYLPDITENVPANIEDLKLWLLKYTSECIDDELDATKALHESITNLVSQINYQISNNEVSSTDLIINYLTVFKPIIFAHINRMLKQYEQSLVNLKVIYLKDDLKNYLTQPWWLNYKPLNFVTINYNENPSSFAERPQSEKKQCSVLGDSIHKIIGEAEETSRRAEQKILEFKRKKQHIYRNFFINASSTSHLKRTLDDSLYQFELSKKCGQYDTSIAMNLTTEIDKFITKIVNQPHISTKIRKTSPLNSSDQFSDADNVIARATKLIYNVESKRRKKYKISID